MHWYVRNTEKHCHKIYCIRTLIIFPYLDYNLLNWSSAYPTNLDCLNVSNKKGREHAAPLFKELDILPLNELIKLKRGTFMWKLDNNLLSQSNSGWLSLSNSVKRKRLNLSKYRIPNPRIDYTKRHNIYSATKLWNTEIPIQLKQSTSLKVFKKSYKNSLIDVHFLLVLLNIIFLASLISTEKKHLRQTLFILLHSDWLNESR